MIEVEDKPSFQDLLEYMKETAPRASGFVVLAFFRDDAPELAQDFDGTVDIDTIIATLEKYKAMYVADELEEMQARRALKGDMQ